MADAPHPMTPNDELTVAERRRAVASFKIRGLVAHEIVKALSAAGMGNPLQENRPWSVETVYADIAFLKAQWREAAAEDTAEHQSAVLAELREVRRAAWQKKDHKTVLQSLQQETRILGIDAAIKIAPSSPEDVFRVQVAGLPEEVLKAIAQLGSDADAAT